METRSYQQINRNLAADVVATELAARAITVTFARLVAAQVWILSSAPTAREMVSFKNLFN